WPDVGGLGGRMAWNAQFFLHGSLPKPIKHFIRRLMLILMCPSLKSEATGVKGRVQVSSETLPVLIPQGLRR
ncbi:hypothetical protein A262_04635, partial [Pseudomonas syringae pv. actinidiae ICMP 19073]